MARVRNLKPGFFKNEDLAECSPWARLCFAGLWVLADREGRLEDRPKRIKGELFAFDSIEVEPLLSELEQHGFSLRYRAPDGRSVIQVLQFLKHQNPHHREPESDLPPPKSPGLYPDATALEPGADDACDGQQAQGQPEASPQLQPPEAQGQPRASPGLEVPKATWQGGQAGRNPEPGTQNKDEYRPSALSARPPTGPPCPTGQIVAAYHEALPSLPRAKLMPDARAKAIRRLWGWVLTSRRSDGQPRATSADEAMAWIAGYFRRAAENDFLMGRGGRSAEHANWRCDLDFLLTDRGMKHVIEKTLDAAA